MCDDPHRRSRFVDSLIPKGRRLDPCFPWVRGLPASVRERCAGDGRAVTAVLTQQKAQVGWRLDLSAPVLLLLGLFLCGLVVLPLGWLLWYSVTDNSGA